jgi:hypothetical protein
MRKSGIVTKIKGAALALAVSGSFIVPAQLATATPAHAMGIKLIIKPSEKKGPRGCMSGGIFGGHFADGDSITFNPGTKDEHKITCHDGEWV